MRLQPSRIALVLSSIVSLTAVRNASAQDAGAAAAPAAETPPPAPPPAEAAPMAPPMALAAPPPAATPPSGTPPAAKQLKIESDNGSSIRLGLLAQPQYQALGSAANSGMTSDLFLRRIRLLVGGTLFKDFEYFFDTDYPNLFRSAAVTNATTMVTTQVKNSPGMNIQDAFVTYRAAPEMLKFDVGYMLPPLSHNAVQGATTLYGWDYFSNTFRHSDVFGSAAPSPVGRDLGVQARGLLVDGHIEYRVGMFQGLRNAPTAGEVGGQNFFRVAARLQINLLDPETGFFYSGTYLGAKRILSVGGSYDFQNDYKYEDGDAILDLPVLDGAGAITAQVNVAHWNGNGYVALPKQTAVMAEAGYRIAAIQFSPIVRFERRWLTGEDETRYVGGLAFWPYGHNSNLKAFYTRIHPGLDAMGAQPNDFNQINVQWQVYFY